MKISHPGEHISKPGYLKQRMKLNPDVFHFLTRLKSSDYEKEQQSLENDDSMVEIILDYSTIYVSNLAEDIIHDVEAELDGEEQHTKHKMAVNQTVSIGMLKNGLVYIILEKNKEEKEWLFQQMYDDISQNLVPIRPDRHYHRTKGPLAAKYSNTHKRVF